MGSWPVRLFLLLVLAIQLAVKTASVTSDLPPVQHRAATAAGSDQTRRAQAMKINIKTTLWDDDTFIIVIFYSKKDKTVCTRFCVFGSVCVYDVN